VIAGCQRADAHAAACGPQGGWRRASGRAQVRWRCPRASIREPSSGLEPETPSLPSTPGISLSGLRSPGGPAFPGPIGLRRTAVAWPMRPMYGP
jgi:hypothetical protein